MAGQTRFGVNSRHMIGLAAIAVKTGQRQILDVVGAALCKRYDVIDGEANVLPLLIGVTVLTQTCGAFTHSVQYTLGDSAPRWHG